MALLEPAHLQGFSCSRPPCLVAVALGRRQHYNLSCPPLFFSLSDSRFRLSSSNNDRHPSLISGHGDLDIVSIKELPDGFLHFSFGVVPNANHSSKMDAAKLSYPRRLPSKFVKKSPIPVVAARRRRKKENLGASESVIEAAPATIGVAVKCQSRPKSCFVRRSPIPTRTIDQALHNLPAENETGTISSTPQQINAVLERDSFSNRPASKFVRRSPIPEGRVNLRSGLYVNASRPRSKFSRKSPIVKSLNNTLQESLVGAKSLSNLDFTKAGGGKMSSKMQTSVIDLDKCKLPELKSLAKSKGLRGYSKLKKRELVDLLRSSETQSDE